MDGGAPHPIPPPQRGEGGALVSRVRSEPFGPKRRLSSRQSTGPVARRREPKGKGVLANLDGWKSGRTCLGWRGNAPAQARQARPDLSRDKSRRKAELVSFGWSPGVSLPRIPVRFLGRESC